MNIQELREEQERLFHTDMLPTICLELRMSVTGAADPWSDIFLKEAVEMLENRCKEWDSLREDNMDRAVLDMVNAAITYGCDELARREESGYHIGQPQ